MEVFYINDINKLPNLEDNTCIIGTFDGVHIGHQSLINKSKDFGLKTLLITFDNQMKTDYFLTTTNQKYNLLNDLGVDYLIIFPFDLIKSILYSNFIIMLEKLSVSNMICGADFRFGFNREGSIKNLEEQFNVSIADYTLVNGVRISSSTIKEYITSGNINGANLFLGRNYSLIGKIKDVDIVDNSTKIEFDYYLHLLPPNGVYKTMIKYRNNIYESVTQILNIDKGDKRIYITVSQPIYNILDNDIEVIFLNN